MIRALLFASGVVLVHSWYPSSCCGGSDCHPVECDSIAEVPGGYVWEGLLFRSERVQLSQDTQCHVCAGLVNARPYHPWCLFILPTA